MIKLKNLKHILKLHTETESRDSLGGVTKNTELFGTRWCEVVTSSQEKDTASDKERPLNQKVFRLRHFQQYKTIKKVEFDGEMLEIVDFENVGEKDKVLVITAESL